MRKLVAVIVMVTVAGAGHAGRAAEEPAAPAASPAPAPAPARAALPERPSMGWPIASSVMAFAFTGAVVGLGVASGLATSEHDKWGGIGLGAGALGTLAIFGPVCSTGQSVARRGTPVWGALGARIPAWVLYGITMAEGVAMLGLGLADVDVPEELIYAATASGGASLILFAVDNLVSISQAQSWYEEQLKVALEPGRAEDLPAFTFTPVIAPVFGLEGRGASGATLGLAGRF